jgi:2-polyprenyl-6-methoxyphenol hydroxylase-like FAD-dependent oxidoreductase
MPPETTHAERRVHIVGAGPVGLMLTALLHTMDTFLIRLYEKRRDYTRTRMVKLDSYLVADSVENYCIDYIDAENVEAVFDRTELDEGLRFRRSIPSDLKALLRNWTPGFCPLNAIERSLSDLIDVRASNSVERIDAAVTLEQAMAMLEPEDILIDCTGSNSLLRDHVVPPFGEVVGGGANTFKIRLEYALVVTFLYSQTYICDEYCKYYKTSRTSATSSFQRSTAPTTTKASAT